MFTPSVNERTLAQIYQQGVYGINGLGSIKGFRIRLLLIALSVSFRAHLRTNISMSALETKL